MNEAMHMSWLGGESADPRERAVKRLAAILNGVELGKLLHGVGHAERHGAADDPRDAAPFLLGLAEAILDELDLVAIDPARIEAVDKAFARPKRLVSPEELKKRRATVERATLALGNAVLWQLRS